MTASYRLPRLLEPMLSTPMFGQTLSPCHYARTAWWVAQVPVGLDSGAQVAPQGGFRFQFPGLGETSLVN